MKRFHFNLDPALRVRRRLEEQAHVELAARQRQLAQAEAQRAELRREMERHEACRAALQRSAVDPSALVDADRYGQALMHALILQEERVRAAEEAVRTSRETLHRRHLDSETLERLRQRRLEEYRQETFRLEQRELDEAFVLRWKRPE